MDIRSIVAEVGGFTRMSHLMGVPISTIHAWARRGRVPHWRVEQINRALEEALRVQSAGQRSR